MKITVEISHYPLTTDYEEQILSFISSLKGHPEVEVFTNAMSTYVTGNFSEVMDLLKMELQSLLSETVLSSTILKIVNRDLPIKDGYLDF